MPRPRRHRCRGVLDDDGVRVDPEQFVFGGIGMTGADLVCRSGYEVAGLFDESDYLDVILGFESGCGLDDLRWEKHRGVFCGDLVDVGTAAALEDSDSRLDA
jgi:hypothetical protein